MKPILPQVERQAYLKWQQEIRSLDVRHKSAAEMGVLLVHVVLRFPGSLGLLARALTSSQPTLLARDSRQRDVLPLPVPQAVTEIVNAGVKQRENTAWKHHKRQGARRLRAIGIAHWTFLTILGLNYMWCGLTFNESGVCSQEAGASQLAALKHIQRSACQLVDQGDEAAVPRTPSWDWPEQLRTKTVSYQGETLEVAQRMTLEEVIPGLPPVGLGGSIKAEDFCRGEVRRLLLNPQLSLLPEDELPEVSCPRSSRVPGSRQTPRSGTSSSRSCTSAAW